MARLARTAGALALALAALVGATNPALAQEPPRSEAARTELAELSRDLRQEAIQRILDSVAQRLDKFDPAKAAIVRAKGPATAAFAQSHLDASLDQVLQDWFAKELKAKKLGADDMKVDASLTKSNTALPRTWDQSYRVRPVAPADVPSEVTGFAPPRQRGYTPEVAALDPTEPHSMHDMDAYVANRFTRTVLERAIALGRTIEVHTGSEDEAMADLRNRGWNVFGDVKTQNKQLFVAESPTGEVRYVIADDVDSRDRLAHFLSLLRFSGQDGQGVPGTGVPGAQVEVVGDIEHVKAVRREQYRDGFARLAHEGTSAIVGYRRQLSMQLADRALARAGIENVRSELGRDPYQGLVDALDAERKRARGEARQDLAALVEAVQKSKAIAKGLAVEPANAFAKIEGTKAVQDAESALAALAEEHPGSKTLARIVAGGKLRLPGGESASDYVASRTIPGRVVSADEYLVRRADGRLESLVVTDSNWGDGAGDIVEGLLGAGRRRIAYFGTAGGLQAGSQMGDIQVPAAVHDAAGARAGAKVSNGWLGFFEKKASALGDRLKLGTKLANVFSPAEETLAWLGKMKDEAFDGVEVELSHIFKAVGSHNAEAKPGDEARLFAAVTVSDVPGSDATLGSHAGSTARTRDLMFDHTIEALGIEGLVLQRATGAPKVLTDDPREARLLDLAAKLVPGAASKSSIQRDRIAGILSALSNQRLAALARKAEGKRKLAADDVTGLEDADRAALEREIAHPYTDAQAATAIEKGNAVVSRVVGELAREFPATDYEVRLGGGVETGSFSPAAGLVLDVRGNPAVRERASALLAEIGPTVADAPSVVLGDAGAGSVNLGAGAELILEPNGVDRLNRERALADRGVISRGASIDYAGRSHEALPARSELSMLLANPGGEDAAGRLQTDELARRIRTRGAPEAGASPTVGLRGRLEGMEREGAEAGRGSAER